jgi:hypothetical protein
MNQLVDRTPVPRGFDESFEEYRARAKLSCECKPTGKQLLEKWSWSHVTVCPLHDLYAHWSSYNQDLWANIKKLAGPKIEDSGSNQEVA